jgi:hypothetical protein
LRKVSSSAPRRLLREWKAQSSDKRLQPLMLSHSRLRLSCLNSALIKATYWVQINYNGLNILSGFYAEIE